MFKRLYDRVVAEDKKVVIIDNESNIQGIVSGKDIKIQKSGGKLLGKERTIEGFKLIEDDIEYGLNFAWSDKSIFNRFKKDYIEPALTPVKAKKKTSIKESPKDASTVVPVKKPKKKTNIEEDPTDTITDASVKKSKKKTNIEEDPKDTSIADTVPETVAETVSDVVPEAVADTPDMKTVADDVPKTVADTVPDIDLKTNPLSCNIDRSKLIEIVKNTGFPFKKYFIRDVSNRFDRLSLFCDTLLHSTSLEKQYSIRDLDLKRLPISKRYQEYSRYIVPGPYDIDVISDIFQEQVRIKGQRKYKGVYSPSIEESYNKNIESIVDTICRSGKDISIEELRETLFTKYGNNELTTFKPTLVRTFVELFRSELNILLERGERPSMLDISAGWGDRLLGAMASDIDYTGCDPNTDLQPGYNSMIGEFGDSNRHVVYPDMFQNFKRDATRKYHIALSSPPYFDLEKYVPDDNIISKNQSITGRDKNSWYKDFLIPSVDIVMDRLHDGGIFILNIANVDSKTRYTEDIVNYIASKKNIDYLGIIAQWVGWKEDVPIDKQKKAQPFFIFKKRPAYIDTSLLAKEYDIFVEGPRAPDIKYTPNSPDKDYVKEVLDMNSIENSIRELFHIVKPIEEDEESF